MKYIFVCGGVLSSLGKGLFCGSLGSLLEMHGYKVKMQKFDPYLNTNPSLMSPYQHGEVYVLKDGAMTDLDLGHYERFTNETFTAINSVSSGQIYKTVVNNGETGVYGGGTVQVIPHVTNEIIRCLKRGSEGKDICLTELGGTTGDIEGLPFLEAFRQFQYEVGHDNCIFIMLNYIVNLKAAGEIKTKPTQQAVQRLREVGIMPDIIVTRSDSTIGPENRKKISFFCNVDTVIEEPNVKLSIYEIPIMLQKQGLDVIVLQKLHLFTDAKVDMSEWNNVYQKLSSPSKEIKLCICGQYIDHQDAQKSTVEAIAHAGIANDCKINVLRINHDKIGTEEQFLDQIKDCAGVIFVDGFEGNGIESIITAIKACRENNIKTFGYGLGMELMVIEYCRNVLGIEGANSEEFTDDEAKQVFKKMVDFKKEHSVPIERLGHYKTIISDKESLAFQAYQSGAICERHRQEYEVDFEVMKKCEEKGLVFSGKTEETGFGDIVELKSNKYYLGAIYRPQFQSKARKCNPLFAAFVKSLIE